MAPMVVFESTRADAGGMPLHIWVHQDHIVMVRRALEGSEITLSTGATILVRNEPQSVASAVAGSAPAPTEA